MKCYWSPSEQKELSNATHFTWFVMQKFLKRLVDDHGSIDLEWLRDVPQRVFAECKKTGIEKCGVCAPVNTGWEKLISLSVIGTQCWSPYKSISGLDCARFGKVSCIFLWETNTIYLKPIVTWEWTVNAGLLHKKQTKLQCMPKCFAQGI